MRFLYIVMSPIVAASEQLRTSFRPILLTVVMLPVLELVLHDNNFVTGSTHYVQINRTAVGSSVSPIYTNLFVGSFENNALQSFRVCPLTYYRYMDDSSSSGLAVNCPLTVFLIISTLFMAPSNSHAVSHMSVQIF